QSAAMVILETPDDAGFAFEHPAGGPTKISAKFVHSLGSFRDPRRARMCFFDKADYNDLAKRYRKHVIETGHFVSLKQKLAAKRGQSAAPPLIERLIGAPVIHTGILYHMQPNSNYFNATQPAK